MWDREIIERVARDQHLSARFLEGLEENNHSWMTNFLASLCFSDSAHYDEAKIYHDVKKTIRAIASAGRAVIVGRGGAFITQDIPGGIHVRLIAPFDDRVALTEKELHLSNKKAAAYLHELDRNVAAFFRQHWAGQSLDAEHFALTINAARLSPAAIAHVLKALVEMSIPSRNPSPR